MRPSITSSSVIWSIAARSFSGRSLRRRRPPLVRVVAKIGCGGSAAVSSESSITSSRRPVRDEPHRTARRLRLERNALGAEDVRHRPERGHGDVLQEGVVGAGRVRGTFPPFCRRAASRVDFRPQPLANEARVHLSNHSCGLQLIDRCHVVAQFAEYRRPCAARATGGAVRTLAGVAESFSGEPITRVVPMVGCCTSAIICRAASCGSASTSLISRTDPHGTPAAPKRATQSSRVRDAHRLLQHAAQLVVVCDPILVGAERGSSRQLRPIDRRGRSAARCRRCRRRRRSRRPRS